MAEEQLGQERSEEPPVNASMRLARKGRLPDHGS